MDEYKQIIMNLKKQIAEQLEEINLYIVDIEKKTKNIEFLNVNNLDLIKQVTELNDSNKKQHRQLLERGEKIAALDGEIHQLMGNVSQLKLQIKKMEMDI